MGDAIGLAVMLDLLFTLVKTAGFLLSLGITAIVPVLFVLALLKRLPWVIAAPAMAVVAAVASYATGMGEGVQRGRVAWEIKVDNLRAALAVKKLNAEAELKVIERRYLDAREVSDLLQQENDRILSDLLSEKKNEKCDPYSMPVDPGLLRHIEKR